MTTGIRPNTFNPRSQGNIDVTSSPSIQNVVVPKSAVQTYNPMAGAGQVGDQIAARLNQMGNNLADFWNLQSANLSTLQEIETRNRLTEIEQENLVQRQEALIDEMADPGGKITKHVNDLDYVQTRMSIRADNAAYVDAISWTKDVLVNLPLVDPNTGEPTNVTTEFQKFATAQTQGMREDMKAFYLASLTKNVTGAIDTHITTLHQQVKIAEKSELAQSIHEQVRTHPMEAFSPSGIAENVAKARVLLPATESDGQVKAWVIEQSLNTLSEGTPDDNAIAGFMNALATNPVLGSNGKTFAENFPQAFEDLSKKVSEQTNEVFEMKNQVAINRVQKINLTLGDPLASTEDKNKAILEYFVFRNDPATLELVNAGHDGLESAINTINSRINSFTENDAYMRETAKWLIGHGPLPSGKSLKSSDKHLADFMGRGTIDPISVGQFFHRSPHITEVTNALIDALSNRNVSSEDSEASSVALSRATQAIAVLQSAQDAGMGPSDLRKKLGGTTYQIYDVYKENLAKGLSPDDALLQANQYITNGELAAQIEAFPIAKAAETLRVATRDDETGWTNELAVATILGGDIEVSAAVANDFLVDFQRYAAGADLSNVDKIKDIAAKVAESFRAQYLEVPSVDDKAALVPLHFFSERQHRMFNPVEGERGVDLVGDQYRAMALPPSGVAVAYTDWPTPPLSFLAALIGDDAVLGGFNDRDSRNNGTFSLNAVDGTMAIIREGDIIEYNHPTRIKENHHENIKTTLKIVPDGTEVDKTPSEVLKTGGSITWSSLKEEFNTQANPFGFELLERTIAGQRVYSIEYAGILHSVDHEKKKAAEELKQKTLEVEEELGKPQLLPAVLAWGMTNNQGEAEREEERVENSDKQVDAAFSKQSDSVISALKNNGQLSASTNITTEGTVDVASVEEVTERTNQLVTNRPTNGIPNEADNIYQEDTYAHRRNIHIASHEGIKYYAYNDTSKPPNPTVGKGFNLNDPSVKAIIIKELGSKKYHQLRRDARQKYDSNKALKLTDPEINRIYGQIILEKERLVSTWYKDIPLTISQRIVIVDLAYNGGEQFVGPKTEFHKSVSEGNWTKAITEIRERSNKHSNAGVQNRMNHNASILSNTIPKNLRRL